MRGNIYFFSLPTREFISFSLRNSGEFALSRKKGKQRERCFKTQKFKFSIQLGFGFPLPFFFYYAAIPKFPVELRCFETFLRGKMDGAGILKERN